MLLVTYTDQLPFRLASNSIVRFFLGVEDCYALTVDDVDSAESELPNPNLTI